MATELELPAAILSEVVEDAAAAVSGQTPTLINEIPAPDSIANPYTTNIQFDLATLDATGTIDSTATDVYVNSVLAVSGGVAQTGFVVTLTNPQADVLRVVVNPDADFTSEQVVTVRVVSHAVGDPGNVLDETYSFTIEDIAPIQASGAVATYLNEVTLTFDDTYDATTALDAANYQLDRLGDYLTPLVSASITSVAAGSTSAEVILTTDIPLTPGGNYRLTLTNVKDESGNVVTAPNDTIDFTGWQPPIPANRVFDLYKKLPRINRQEDDTLDLYRFIACLQEVAGLLLYDIDRFVEILDPDTAPEDFVDAMLADLGNPFEFDLSLLDKRRLAQILVDMYQLKGTAVGIVNVIRFFLGLESQVISFNSSLDSWILGESTLGDDTYLGGGDQASLYSFYVFIPVAIEDLSLTEQRQINSIVNYMKPAHEHYIRLETLSPSQGALAPFAADGTAILSWTNTSGTAALAALAGTGTGTLSWSSTSGTAALAPLAGDGTAFREALEKLFIEDLSLFDGAMTEAGGISSGFEQ